MVKDRSFKVNRISSAYGLDENEFLAPLLWNLSVKKEEGLDFIRLKSDAYNIFL
jgi:hypothetical protein